MEKTKQQNSKTQHSKKHNGLMYQFIGVQHPQLVVYRTGARPPSTASLRDAGWGKWTRPSP